jgi:hypothetical protein
MITTRKLLCDNLFDDRPIIRELVSVRQTQLVSLRQSVFFL